jgi:hypothetical protein
MGIKLKWMNTCSRLMYNSSSSLMDNGAEARDVTCPGLPVAMITVAR